ncbi:MAG: hypothetical protein AAF226_05570, partial [Verrucomicrobiota bacterium]
VINGYDDIDHLLESTGDVVDSAGSNSDLQTDDPEHFNKDTDVLLNTAYLTYDQADDDSEVKLDSSTSVAVEVVEPLLQMQKYVSNGGDTTLGSYYSLNDDGVVTTLDDGTPFGGGADQDDDGTVNDFTVAGLGQNIIFRMEFEHTEDSTADAFDVRLIDTIDVLAASGYGSILTGSVVVIDLSTGLPAASGFTDNSSATLLDVSFDHIEIGQSYAVEFIVDLLSDPDLLLERGGSNGIDIHNTADLIWYSIPEEDADDVAGDDKTERRGRITRDSAEVSIVAPDLYIDKNDGNQERELDDAFEYTLTFGNKSTFDEINAGLALPANPEPFTEDVGPAIGVIVTDILPPMVDYQGIDSDLPYPLNFVGTGFSLAPQPGDYIVDGQMIQVYVGELLPGDQHQINIEVKVLEAFNDDDIVNTASIDGAFGDVFYLDNETEDIDTFILQGGGYSIMQGFRFDQPFQGEEEEFDKPQPILTMMPIYSGLADPGTVIKIRVQGQLGEPLQNGEQTVVADAGGNWLAKMPGLVLVDQPHAVVIEQTRPAWDLVDGKHGYNFRTYFAPAISPTHTETESMDVDNVMGRRLSPMVMDLGDQHGVDYLDKNLDWRLGEQERYASSGIAGM